MQTRLDRGSRRSRHHDETGTALVELALVIPLVMLLLGVAFNGWNSMQESIRLTSAARAGAIVAAHDLTATASNPTGTSQKVADDDATTAINAEEGATAVYQDTDSGANNYVSLTPNPNITISAGVTISTVTITISHSSVSFVPFVGSFPVTTHATARYA
jgi:Flp pilus assembly protein TadG